LKGSANKEARFFPKGIARKVFESSYFLCIEVFEQSQFSNEIRVAINVGPNATRVLKRLGYDEKRLRGVPCAAVRETFEFIFWTPLTFPDYSA
jgi:hypothetical protein